MYAFHTFFNIKMFIYFSEKLNKTFVPQIKTEDKKLPLTVTQIMEDLPNTFVFIQVKL